MAEEPKKYANCKVKLTEWCSHEKPALGHVNLENNCGQLFMSSVYEPILQNPENPESDVKMKNESESGNVSDCEDEM